MWKYPHLLGLVVMIASLYFAHLLLCAVVSAREASASTLNKAEALSKIQKLSVPFISNQGQMEKKVRFYAKTLGGTVFVTEEGEIVYSIPKLESYLVTVMEMAKRRLMRCRERSMNFWVLPQFNLVTTLMGVAK